MRMPTHEDVLAARSRIAGRVVHTPILRNAWLDELTGGTILIKPEPLQRTGSFKLRGATNAVLALATPASGLAAYSSGNHGQAVACVAASLGLQATIFMPSDAPLIKVASTERWGAAIVRYDRATEDREALAQAFSERTGAALIPPFEHPDIIAGQGTVALELAADAASAGLTLNALLVCTGGGGLIAGCGLAMAGVSSRTAIIAVEPEGWDDTRRSLAAGARVVNAPGGSPLCDALLAPMPGALTFALNRTLLAGAVAVSDAEVLHAMAFAFTHLKIVAEPGGAVALAALLSGRFPARGKAVGCVISGGNVDPAVFARALSGG